MKVTAILKGKVDSSGLRTVCIRIANGEDRTYKSTKIKIRPADWDKKEQKVRYSCPKATLYNSILKKLLVEIQAAAISDRYEVKSKDIDFFKFCDICISEWEVSRRTATLLQLRVQRNKIAECRPSFRLRDINNSFLKALLSSLYARGNTQNTAWNCFKFLNAVVRKAIREGYLDRNPLEGFDRPKYRNPQKVFLTADEVAKVDAFARACTTKGLAHAANWFLIGCYTGLRFGDLRYLDVETNIRNGWIIVHMEKTQKTVSVPLNDRLRELLRRVNDRPLKLTNTVYNRHLKKVQEGTGIKKPFSAHLSRHTFATLCASSGIPIEIAAELLGHSNIRETSIYYKITSQRVATEFRKLC